MSIISVKISNRTSIIIILFSLLCIGCVDFHERQLSLRNSSAHAITIISSQRPNSDTYYPVGHANNHNPILVPIATDKIIDSFISDAIRSDPTYFTVYAFKTSTLQRYSWEEIVEGNIYDGVLFMSVAELEKRNWKIIYPDDFELDSTE